MSTLTIRFAGICCFLDPRPNSQDAFKKRVILPVDQHVSERNDGPHIPYIETDILDEPKVTGRFAATAIYPRQAGTYRRFHLSGDRIKIRNTAPPAYGLNVLSTYKERIPAISKVTRGALSYPDPEFFDARPPQQKVAAYFDIEFGDLHAGPASLKPTKFAAPTDWPTRRLASWVELQVPIIDGVKPVIEVEKFNGGNMRTIEISENADHITIGNQLLGDIEARLPQSDALPVENFQAHFSIIYDLFSADTSTASRPENTMTVVNGCIGSNIP